MKSKLALLAGSVALVTGCAKTVDVLTNYDHAYDFKRLRTYAWTNDPLSEVFPPQAQDPAGLDALIKAAIDADLGDRDYRRSDKPDFYLRYRVHASDRISAEKPPASWDPSQDITKYVNAALVLDVVDAGTSTRVWRGAALTDIQRGKGRKAVQATVDNLLKDFPPKQ